MNHEESTKNRKKVVAITLTSIVALIIILILLSLSFLYHYKNQKIELGRSEDNILYINEAKQEEEENNILIVELDRTSNESEETEEQKTEEEQEEVVEEETPEEVNDDNETNENQEKASYYIKVNNEANVVTVYTKDSNGEYTVPVKAMICSVGTSTPESGVYTISDKYTWRLLVGNVYGQYACRITGSILFHSVPYEKQDKSTLEWWEYDKLGESASLGCVRLTVEDAKWIYDNCESGTQVEFYSSSDPGPLGKPTAQKISDNEELRNWDPTDPDPDNPWNQ